MNVSSASLAATATTTVKSILCGLALLTCAGSMVYADEPHRVTGKVFIQQVQIAFIGSGAAGKGTLTFRGHTYPIKVVGLGVGGVGLSKLTATGDVYDLKTLSDFQGLYGQARLGWAIARQGNGHLWLANTKGVTLKLTTRRQGLILSGGADGVDIRFAQ
jgi:hypothetical protein